MDELTWAEEGSSIFDKPFSASDAYSNMNKFLISELNRGVHICKDVSKLKAQTKKIGVFRFLHDCNRNALIGAVGGGIGGAAFGNNSFVTTATSVGAVGSAMQYDESEISKINYLKYKGTQFPYIVQIGKESGYAYCFYYMVENGTRPKLKKITAHQLRRKLKSIGK